MGGARETLSRRGIPATVRARRALLLGLVLFVLATGVPDGAAAGRKRRRDPQLQDAGPPPFTGTCVDSTGQKFPCPPAPH